MFAHVHRHEQVTQSQDAGLAARLEAWDQILCAQSLFRLASCHMSLTRSSLNMLFELKTIHFLHSPVSVIIRLSLIQTGIPFQRLAKEYVAISVWSVLVNTNMSNNVWLQSDDSDHETCIINPQLEYIGSGIINSSEESTASLCTKN